MRWDLDSLRSLQDFPWRFYVPDQVEMRDRLATSIYEHLLIGVFRTWCDTDRRSLNLRHFKNEVMKRLPEAAKPLVQSGLSGIVLEDNVRDSLSKIALLRNRRVGHIDWTQGGIFEVGGPWPSLMACESCFHFLSDYLAQLTFPYSLLPYRDGPANDFQELLDSLARESEVSRLLRMELHGGGKMSPLADSDALADFISRGGPRHWHWSERRGMAELAKKLGLDLPTGLW